MKRYLALDSGWSVTAGTIDVPASVPGVVHTDLLAAGLIPDPYLDDNETVLGWIGRTQWRYRTTFTWEPTDGNVHELVCEGLDTLAAIEVNSTPIARTANQHRSYRFDVTALLHGGVNEVTVTFDSALDYAERVAAEHPRPHVNHHPYNAIRKMACNFGWDWGPDLVTAGIWRPIGIESWKTARIESVRPLVIAASEESAVVRFEIAIERDGTDAELTGVVRVGSVLQQIVIPSGANHATVELEVSPPALWWPRSHGDQPLYDTSVVLDGLDDWQARIGLRTVEVDTTDGGFGLRVNGQDVFVRGANWIPDDAFPSRVDAARYARGLDDACEAGINLLRVWGGGIYESEEFYRQCDALGLLVWQDFLFACATYAEEELHDEVEAEARQAVTRLSAHPSLAVWNGANENLWGFVDWGWRAELAGRSWGEGFYYDLLPSIVAELDPTRPYIPGSPFSPDRADHPNDPGSGLVHIWDVWNEKDYRVYRDYRPRFVAEFGFQGPPNFATMSAAIRDDPLTPHSPVMVVHQKAEDGNTKLERGWHGHFPDPVDLDGWHWTTQLNQARAITCGIEWFRSLAPYCRGAIVWQLNDCWPVVSWAAVDGYGRRKPLWYALRHAYADRLLTIQDTDDALLVTAVNDSPSRWSGPLGARRMSFDGTVLASQEHQLVVEPRGTATLALDTALSRATDEKSELVVVECEGTRAFWYFAEDVDLALPEPRLTGSLSGVDGGYQLDVRAESLIRDLTPQVDRLDPEAVVDEQLVTLLPGERFTFLVRSAVELGLADLLPVLRSANELVFSSTTKGHSDVTKGIHRGDGGVGGAGDGAAGDVSAG